MDIATIQVKAAKGDNGDLTFVASTDRVDRMGDIIAQRWDLKSFRETGGPFLYGHRHSDLPIGRVLKVWTEKADPAEEATRRTMIMVRFAPAELHPFADQVRKFYEAGYLKSVSVGFRPKKIKQLTPDEKVNLGMPAHGLYFEESELLEVSAVPVPANPDAVIADIDDSVGVAEWEPTRARLIADEAMVVRSGADPAGVADWLESIDVAPPDDETEERQPAMHAQSLVFAKKDWTVAAAKKWAKDHDFHAGKVDETEESVRLRQFEPGECKRDSFRSKLVPGAKGITMVMCRKKSEAEAIVDELRELRAMIDPVRVLERMADAIERVRTNGRGFEQAMRVAAMLARDQITTPDPDESEADEAEDDLDESALEEALDLIEE